MLEKLEVVQLTPRQILDFGCGGGEACRPLLGRFPGAEWFGVDIATHRVRQAEENLLSSHWWQALTRRKLGRVVLGEGESAVPPGPKFDLVWSNMVLHWHPDPPALLSRIFDSMNEGGLVAMSWLGPYSLQELRQPRFGADTGAHLFLDLHDVGDWMARSGFSGPVMDMELLTLTYRDWTAFYKDLRSLVANPRTDRFCGLRGRTWLAQLNAWFSQQLDLHGECRVTVEVCYGHAWKAATRTVKPQVISLEKLRG